MNTSSETILQATHTVGQPFNSTQPDTPVVEEKFTPNGAIAFFVVLIVLCLIIWYGVYFLMLSRS